jgi:hypothetical protein
MRTTCQIAITIAVLLALGTSLAYAVPVRVDVAGSVNSVDEPFFGMASYGASMSGYFIYDADLVTRRTMFGVDRFFHYTPVIEYELNLGGITGTGSAGRIEVTNDHTDSSNRFLDRIIVESGGIEEPSVPVVEAAFPVDAISVGFTFYDYVDANAIDAGLNLPPVLPLGSMDYGSPGSHVSIQAIPSGTGEWTSVFAKITSFNIQIIPEPSSLILGALASIGVLMRRRRYCQQSAPRSVSSQQSQRN